MYTPELTARPREVTASSVSG